MSIDNETNPTVIAPIARSTEGLQDVAFDALEQLRAGSITPAKAMATAKLIGAIAQTVHPEIQAEKLGILAGPDSNSAGPRVLRLGTARQQDTAA